MLKQRIAATLLIDKKNLVKGKNFQNYRKLNDLISAVNIFCLRDIDELILLDIKNSTQKKCPDFNFIKEISRYINVPMVYGGGITSVDDALWCLKSGADRVIINSYIYSDIKLIEKISKVIGSQSVIASIDYKVADVSKYICYSHAGTIKQKIDFFSLIKKLEELGAGELMLCNISNEGTMTGFDNETLKKIKSFTNLPIIVSGGAGEIFHYQEAFNNGASCAAAGSIFQFTKFTPEIIKRKLVDQNLNLRKIF